MFDLHHVIAKYKAFNLSAQNMTDKPMKTVWKEIDKCVPLCANCHRLHHHTAIPIITKETEREFKHKHILQNIRRFHRAKRFRAI